LNTITTSNHDNGNTNKPSAAVVVTEAEVEAILTDAEFISAILAGKGARHMVGVLTIELAVAFVALGYTREQAAEKAGVAVAKAYDLVADVEKTIN
jgi:hypothetical protein